MLGIICFAIAVIAQNSLINLRLCLHARQVYGQNGGLTVIPPFSLQSAHSTGAA
jgi:hypothetical protein